MISPTGFVHITNIDVGEFHKRKIAKFLKFRNLTILYVIRLGFEPKTHSLEGCCSIQLSYRTGPLLLQRRLCRGALLSKVATKIIINSVIQKDVQSACPQKAPFWWTRSGEMASHPQKGRNLWMNFMNNASHPQKDQNLWMTIGLRMRVGRPYSETCEDSLFLRM